jgi:transcriptional regulator with XRE-family HTH domain
MTRTYKPLYGSAMAELTDSWDAWERNFIQQMQRLREAHGMTQTDLARQAKSHGLKFHQQTIQRIESGQRPIRLGEAHVIASIFGVHLEEMTSGERSSEELRLAALRLLNTTSDLSDYIAVVLPGWIEEANLLASILSDRISRNPELLERSTIWGLVCADRVARAFGHITFHLKYGARLGRGNDAIDELAGKVDGAIKKLDELVEPYQDLVRYKARAQTLDELDASYPAENGSDRFDVKQLGFPEPRSAERGFTERVPEPGDGGS